MSKLLAIDPGVHLSGFAAFEDKRLVAVGYAAREPFGWGFDHTAIEVPRWRDNHPRPNDLLDLAFSAGKNVGNSRCTVVFPNPWKGNVPKDICETRIKKILSPDEKDRLDRCLAEYKESLHNHMYDAMGVGLFVLGRAGRGMVPL